VQSHSSDRIEPGHRKKKAKAPAVAEKNPAAKQVERGYDPSAATSWGDHRRPLRRARQLSSHPLFPVPAFRPVDFQPPSYPSRACKGLWTARTERWASSSKRR
jgi:hypothetical protein